MKYSFLWKEPGPKMLVEALKLYGVKELDGDGNNAEIIKWAEELGLKKTYSADSIPWCGLFVAIVAKRAGKVVPAKPLWARNWLNVGTPVDVAMLGDIVIFARGSAGHVGIYVGEDKDNYYILGGNQSDAVNIVRKSKKQALGVRRPKYNNQPSNVRRIYLTGGTQSVKEN